MEDKLEQLISYSPIHQREVNLMKKGSLSLSVNAIVVLILAITMLGLGLGFMKGMFGKVSERVDQAVSNTNIENLATADHPLVFSAKDITLTRGESKQIDVGFYNNFASKVTQEQAVLTMASCIDSQGAASDKFSIVNQKKNVEVGQQVSLPSFIKADSTTASGKYICTIQLVSGTASVSEDLTITVT
jgi:hypothetical protein